MLWKWRTILARIANLMVLLVINTSAELNIHILDINIRSDDSAPMLPPVKGVTLAVGTPFLVPFRVECMYENLDFSSFQLMREGFSSPTAVSPRDPSPGFSKNDTYNEVNLSVKFNDGQNLCPIMCTVNAQCDRRPGENLKFEVNLTPGGASVAERKSVELKMQCANCTRSLSKTDLEVIFPPEAVPVYGTQGHFHCINPEAILFNSHIPAEDNGTECSYNAQWKNARFMDCWTAPLVILNHKSVIAVNETKSVTLTSDGSSTNFSCQVASGNPAPEVEFRVKDVRESLHFNPNYTHHNQDAYCLYWSNFTEYYDPDLFKKKSNIIRLNVQFPPVVIVEETSSCIEQNGAIKYHATFFSNPRMDSSTLRFEWEGNGTLQNSSIAIAPGHTRGIQNQMLTGILNVSPSTRLSLIVTSGQFLNKTVLLPNIKLQKCSEQTTTTKATIPELDSAITIAAIAGGGGFFLIVLASLLVFLMIKRRRKADINKDVASTNPAYCESSASNHGSSEREDRLNILYGTADDLKSAGSSGTKVEVDNILYGSTPGPQPSNDLYSTVDKPTKKKQGKSNDGTELYTTVQKTKKKQGKSKGVDPGASTSGLQSDDTYAEVNKERKKKKDGKKTGKGQENSGFAGDAQQDATYAVVDKKKNKGAKGKKADEPGTSGLVEEATYAVVNKKDKKPKKDGPDDDLHGSNKP